MAPDSKQAKHSGFSEINANASHSLCGFTVETIRWFVGVSEFFFFFSPQSQVGFMNFFAQLNEVTL